MGTYITVPCLFFIQLLRITLPLINKKALIIAANYTFLLGSTLFVLKMVSEFLYSIFGGVEYEQYVISNPYFNSFWFTLSLIAIANLLPQLLWIKKARQTATFSFGILCIWFLKFLIEILFPEPGWHLEIKPGVVYYIGCWATYIIIISAIYFFLNKKDKSLERLGKF